MSKLKCTNADIEITTLTDDLIVSKCDSCGGGGTAKRENYSKAEWEKMQEDAKKHQAGGFDNEAIE